MTSTEVVSNSRLVTIDGNGCMHPTQGEPVDVIADQLFAVVVVWNLKEGSSWVGWLSTDRRRRSSRSNA